MTTYSTLISKIRSLSLPWRIAISTAGFLFFYAFYFFHREVISEFSISGTKIYMRLVLAPVLFSVWLFDLRGGIVSVLLGSLSAFVFQKYFVSSAAFALDEQLSGIGMNLFIGFVFAYMKSNSVRLQTVIKENEKRGKALDISNKALITILDSIEADTYVIAIETYTILYMNRHMIRSFGEDFTGKLCYQVFQCNDEPCEHCNIDELKTQEKYPEGVKIWEGENPVTGKWYINYDRIIQWINGKNVKIQIAVDISERKKAEEELRKALEEKDILFREAYHRIKNNLSMVASLINLQKYYLKHEDDVSYFDDLKARINSIALIHSNLYKSRHMQTIDLDGYIEDLVANIKSSLAPEDSGVTFSINLEHINIDVDRAIPLGLIITELVTNALKYGINKEKGGTVSIQLTEKENAITVVIGNDGNTFPESIDFENVESFGLKMVHSLTEQIGGEVKLKNHHATEIEIHFPLVEHTP